MQRHLFFFFKQKTAYDLSLRDWSSDVCSSDLLCHTASVVAGGQGSGVTASTLECTMSGIANSLSSAVSPTTVPCKHRTTSRSRPAARRLSRRSNDGASTRRLSGWELRIAESAGVRVACAAARPGAASVPTVSHTVTHSARRISYNSETRGVKTAPALLLLHFATPSTIVPSRKPRAARGVTCRCLGAYAFQLAPVFRKDPLTAYDFRLAAVA